MASTAPCVLLSLMLQMILMSSCLPRNPGVIRSRKSMRSSKTTPQFMVDLYNNYSKRGIKPVPEIVRCFTGTGSQRNLEKVPAGTRQISHTFTFNISGIQRNERVNRVHFRLFTTLPDNRTSLEIELFHFNRLGKQKLVDSRIIHGPYSDWAVFNRMHRTRSWLQRNPGNFSNYQLQVKPRSLSLNKLDIGGLEKSEKVPLLVVFSKEAVKTQTNQQVNQVSASSSSLSTKDRTQGGAARLQRRQETCRRKPLYIDFNSIGWDDWVIEPSGYQAYKCAGECIAPIGSEYDPENRHAIVQTLANKLRIITSAPCCVPKNLGPIVMMYLDENGVLTLRSRYESMVAESCVCT